MFLYRRYQNHLIYVLKDATSPAALQLSFLSIQCQEYDPDIRVNKTVYHLYNDKLQTYLIPQIIIKSITETYAQLRLWLVDVSQRSN